MRFVNPLVRTVFAYSVLAFSSVCAQNHAVNLELNSINGPIEIQIGDQLSRNADTGGLYLTGGVQVRQSSGGVLLANEADIFSHISTENSTLAQIDALHLRGQVLIQRDQLKIQADEIKLTSGLRHFSALGNPVVVQFEDQKFIAKTGLYGNFDTQTFYGFGGAELASELVALRGNNLQISLPISGQANDVLLVLGEGDIVVESQDVKMSAEHIESSRDGRFLYLSGDTSISSPTGTVFAASILFDLETQEFSLDSLSRQQNYGQEFLSL